MVNIKLRGPKVEPNGRAGRIVHPSRTLVHEVGLVDELDPGVGRQGCHGRLRELRVPNPRRP